MFENFTRERTGSYLAGSREDLAAIFNYQWKTPRHMREATKLLLASYLYDLPDDFAVRSTFATEDFLYLKERAEAQLQLAANPSSNAVLLEYLRRQSPETKVLELIAGNPNCSTETLRKLALHSSPEVRACVSENNNCDRATIELLANDEHPDVRFAMAENGNICKDVLKRLADDENPFVADRARQTLKRLESSVVCGNFRTQEDNRLRLVNRR